MNININNNRLEIDIISHCNCNCRYCYRKEPKECQFLKIEDIRHLPFDDYYVVELIGGEILLHPELCDIVEYIVKETKMALMLTTNLTINPSSRLIDLMLKYYPRVGMCVSIDSYSKDLHDQNRKFKNSNESCYDITIKNFKYLKSIGVKIIPHVTINRTNGHILYDTMKYLQDSLGCQTISYSFVTQDYSDILRKVVISQFEKLIGDPTFTASFHPEDYISKIEA